MKTRALFVALLLTACGNAATNSGTVTPDACNQVELAAFLRAVDAVSRRFDDGTALARSTPRADLSNRIADLQVARRDAEDLTVPSCAEQAKQALVAYMSQTIEAFIDFLAQESGSKVNEGFDLADQYYSDFQREVSELRTGNPTPTLKPTQGPAVTSSPLPPIRITATP